MYGIRNLEWAFSQETLHNEQPDHFYRTLGFIGAYLGTVLSKEKEDKNKFAEVLFKSNTGYGISSAKNH